jgi:hypothetical protein
MEGRFAEVKRRCLALVRDESLKALAAANHSHSHASASA